MYKGCVKELMLNCLKQESYIRKQYKGTGTAKSVQSHRVPGGCSSQMSRQSAHESGKVVSPAHLPPSTPRTIVQPERLCQWKIPIIPSKITPTTFQLIAQCLNQHTYSMVQSPSWEANWFAASQEIPRISQNLKVHCRTHKRPPPVSILGQPNPVHIPTSHLLEIHPNIIHPSMPRSPQWSPSLRFPHQDPIPPPLLTHTCHMPSPSHSSRFYHRHNIGWGVQIT